VIYAAVIVRVGSSAHNGRGSHVLKARLGIDRTGFEISPENCKLTFSFCTPQTVVHLYYSTEWLMDISDDNIEKRIIQK